ncbi:hypothetical protein BKI49_03900 [Streptomyces sp. Tue6028]|uniref:DUF6777 domain-containing protein n=1 Tax=Streptomyces sp. Tue6028 TaxID=2036037 RepID=UPI000BB3D9A9|nr:DUF6777 domain-containing protein [Streptomyces sp. Tue6028]PBC65238.1 hypothetical protein BKI49_03900 [Streptomyces sp. Tue6028]
MGISQADPFFEEDGRLGRDTKVPEAPPSGGVQASNSPGLYGGTPDDGSDRGGDDSGGEGPSGDGTGDDSGSGGGSGGDGSGGSTAGQNGGSPGQDATGGATGEFGGSTKPGTCAVAKLKQFLTAPENSAKAKEWARALHIRPDQIPGYIDHLTPVVLRHDTLVTNHQYKRGKAVPFDALLQAGIAVLVDRQGLPAVKCSCGNPLRPSKVNVKKASVRFEDGNKKWSEYRQDHIVVVEPPPGDHRIDRLQLIDVQDPDRGIARRLGTDGSDDEAFDPHAEHTVPTVTGLSFAEATQALAGAGLAMAYDGDALPPDDAQVTASQPVEGSTLEWGAPVTLSVAGDDSEDGSTPTDSGGLGPDPSDSGTGAGPSGTSTGTGGTPTDTAGTTTGTGGTPTDTAGTTTGTGGTPTDTAGTTTGTGGTPTDTAGTTTGTGGTPTDTGGSTGYTSAGTSGATSSSPPPGTPEGSLSADPGPSDSAPSGSGGEDSVPADPGVGDSATDSGGTTGDTS